MSRDEIKLTALRDAAATAEGILASLIECSKDSYAWTFTSLNGQEFLRQKLKQCHKALEDARCL